MTDSLSELQAEFPALGRVLDAYIGRLRVLPDGLGTRSWLWRIAESHRVSPRPERTAYLREWEGIASILDDAANSELSRRFIRTIPKLVTGWLGAYDDGLLDAFSELLAYGWLKRRGCSIVKFVPEEGSRVPDLLGDDAVVVECKHFRTSDKNNNYFANQQGEVMTVSVMSVEGLQVKIENTFKNDVLPKFASYPEEEFERIMFADISPDVELWGPIEGEAPGTIAGIAAAVGREVSKHGVKLFAIQDHTFGRQLTPVNVRPAKVLA